MVEEEAERRSEGEADDVDGDVVGERGGQSQDVVGEEQAELGDADAARVGEEEEDGFTSGVVAGAPPVGPHSVGHPRVAGGDRGRDELGGVGVPGEDGEGSVLEEVEQSGVNDVGGGANQPELDELAHPRQEAPGEAHRRGRGSPPASVPPIGGGVRESTRCPASVLMCSTHPTSVARPSRAFDPRPLRCRPLRWCP